MTLYLLKVPSALNTLVSKLSHDADIQNRIQGISARALAAADAYKLTFDNEGGSILVQKSHLMSTVSTDDVRITSMKNSLNAAIEALQSNKNLVINLQTDIHSNIETCRGRKMEHDSALSTKRERISNISTEIGSLDENIKVHEEEAVSAETGAAELEGRRDSIRRAARKKRKRAGIGGIVGVALAPFTGGLSLGLATVYAGVNLNDAGDCERQANRLREEANSKREHVKQLRAKKEILENQKLSLDEEATSLQAYTDDLDKASQVLEEVTDFLRRSIVDIDNVLVVFQDMESAFSETVLQTDSFKIIQNAFAKQPNRLDSLAQNYLDQLKCKWTQLETTIVENSTRSNPN
ncbi:uncharacterized protein LOC132713901 isoform X2 [Ruditapes philippinarum]|uniref:uncharacterized protein LOC132713901 isoform X2 n=1 Tax=Ruditapes philippinarum TaxID=129788 RepID=UPI00295B6BB7|nr:uncharacterized protein LOC132713901 isoform X2 [Ruditapes philippinarum]